MTKSTIESVTKAALRRFARMEAERAQGFAETPLERLVRRHTELVEAQEWLEGSPKVRMGTTYQQTGWGS